MYVCKYLNETADISLSGFMNYQTFSVVAVTILINNDKPRLLRPARGRFHCDGNFKCLKKL